MGVRRGEAPRSRVVRAAQAARRAAGAPRRSGAGYWGPASDGDGGRGAKPQSRRMTTPQLTPAVPTRFLSIDDLTHDELQACLRLAAELKAARAAGIPHEQPLAGKHIALLFEKPSLRTRSTFQIAVRELGGTSDRAAAGGSIRRARNDRRRRAQSRALGLRRRRADLRAGTARGVRGCRPAPPCRQRADR